MKTILMVNDKLTGGGAEGVMHTLIARLAPRYHITVLTLDGDEASAARLLPKGVTYRPFRLRENPYGRLHPLHYWIRLQNQRMIRALQKERYDIVMANKEGPCMKLTAPMKARRKLAWVHVDYRSLYWTHYTFGPKKELACMRAFDRVIPVSAAAADGVRQVIGDPGNLEVCYNPIDYRRVESLAAEPLSLPKPIDGPLWVAVGRIVQQKNFQTLARVAARLSRQYPFTLWIVGDGEERAAVEQILHQENCDCVRILGMQDNPYPYMAAADLLVSTSLGESYGLVIQEALILGTPVLSTRCPAIEECLDERFGQLVECTEDAIYRGLKMLLENPRQIDRFKEAIATDYHKSLLWEDRLAAIEALIDPPENP